MNPRLLFWIPAFLRLCLVAVVAGLVWYFSGLVFGVLTAIGILIAMLVLQLRYLERLSQWLENPDSSRLPDGWGAWTEIFARLYRLTRDDEKNRAELSEWLARFRQAMRLLPDGVVIMDDVLFLEWCNPLAEKHLGLDLERDRGMRVTNLVRAPEFIDYVILARYEQPLTMTIRGRKLIVHLIPFESRRQILVTHDVTENERIDTMRRDFVANASHELRTPLTVINGFLEIALAQPDLDGEVRASHLRLMAEQGRRMQNLIEDMLVLTRLESADYPVHLEQVHVAELVRQVHQEAVALSAGRHSISFAADGPDIRGSTDELHSAFGNLVSNAVRYTPQAGHIAIHWHQGENGPEFVVRDNGIGISPQHLSRLTERFFRVDKGLSRETQGTGLGLAIVKHVLLRHSASLEIDSTPGQGSVFTAKFPAAATIGQT
jgi:two-component system, OmpR family, phosphate regulon sensor histidine kinase PhoR